MLKSLLQTISGIVWGHPVKLPPNILLQAYLLLCGQQFQSIGISCMEQKKSFGISGKFCQEKVRGWGNRQDYLWIINIKMIREWDSSRWRNLSALLCRSKWDVNVDTKLEEFNSMDSSTDVDFKEFKEFQMFKKMKEKINKE